MQIVWHGNYYKYFDAAREKLFDEAGLDLYKTHVQAGIVFPVTRCRAKYIRPLRYRDSFDCIARVIEAEYRIVVDFEIRLASDDSLCTRGRSEQVTVRLPEGVLELRVPENVKLALSCVNP
jgi:acyl-CoA thioester hydrolase